MRDNSISYNIFPVQKLNECSIITPVIKEVKQNDLFLFLNFRNQFHCLELDLKGQLNHDTGDENQFSVHPLRPAAPQL